MSQVYVYYSKGDIPEDLITSVFTDPTFVLHEAEFPSDLSNYDIRLRSVLEKAQSDPNWKMIVFVRKLVEQGKNDAALFINDVLSGKDVIMLSITSNFSAVAVPRSKITEIIGDLTTGFKFFESADPPYTPYVATCAVVNRNVMTAFIIIFIAILFIVASKVKTPISAFLMAISIVLLLTFIVIFSA